MQREADSEFFERCDQIEEEWLIKSFLNLHYQARDYIQSPNFFLGNVDFCLGIYPHGCREDLDNEWVSLFLKRTQHLGDLRVSFSFRTKPSNLLPEDGEYEYTFTQQKQSWLKQHFFKRSTLKKLCKNNGTLSIICKARLMEGKHLRFVGFEYMSASFEQLFHDGYKTDVTLKVQGKVFEAHKLILQARSPVFRAMFLHEMSESISGVVVIPDLNPEHFNDFLLFVYTGNLELVTPQNAIDLYKAADKYNFLDLARECICQLATELSVDNVLDVILFAGTYKIEQIMKKAEEYFFKHAEVIVSTDKWNAFMVENTQTANELILEIAREMQSNTTGVKRKLDNGNHSRAKYTNRN